MPVLVRLLAVLLPSETTPDTKVSLVPLMVSVRFVPFSEKEMQSTVTEPVELLIKLRLPPLFLIKADTSKSALPASVKFCLRSILVVVIPQCC
mgnify:CR=1 FL=1